MAAGSLWTSPWWTSPAPTSRQPPTPSERHAWTAGSSTCPTTGSTTPWWRRCLRRARSSSSCRRRRRWRWRGTAATGATPRLTPRSSTPHPNSEETSRRASTLVLPEMLTNGPNQWPSEERFPSWKDTKKLYHATALVTSKRILSLIALSLDLDTEFFENIGVFSCPSAVLRLLHYPGEINESDNGNYGASAHSDYGMITLLICREKDRHPQLREDVHHVDGALIVNIADLLERWTNCLFRSTLHRVVAVGKERYSVAFFLNASPDLVVQCLENCCCQENPPRFPPIRSGDYLKQGLSTI